MEEGVLRANVIEAKINDVSVRYERAKQGDESEFTSYDDGSIVPAERIIQSAGFKVRTSTSPSLLSSHMHPVLMHHLKFLWSAEG